VVQNKVYFKKIRFSGGKKTPGAAPSDTENGGPRIGFPEKNYEQSKKFETYKSLPICFGIACH
jgi:hypothetical protein